jgi:cell division protein FtsI/penicillin-binding protein 2
MTPVLTLLLLGSLYDQWIEKQIDKTIPNSAQVSYILLDTRSGTVVAQRWEQPERPIPVGSLVKPFLALAYGTGESFPVYECRPKECWLKKGHGTVDITAAVAQSCNSYFLQLAPGITPDALHRFGLASPADTSAETLIGLGGQWKISPLALARAYGLLAADLRAAPIRRGMLESSQHGTGRAIAMKALVKTGTAPCEHPKHLPGDGYVVALYPPEAPKYTLLLQMHGVPGATAAATAGKMLRTILTGK